MFGTWGVAAPLVFRVATDKGRHGLLGFARAPQGSWLRADSTFADPRKHGAPCCFPCALVCLIAPSLLGVSEPTGLSNQPCDYSILFLTGSALYPPRKYPTSHIAGGNLCRWMGLGGGAGVPLAILWPVVALSQAILR